MTGRRSRRRCSSAGRIVGYDEIAVVRLDSPAPAVVRGNAMEWVDRRGLAPGRRYVYVVTATDAQGRISAPSERLAVPYLAAPRPPRALRATPGDRRITLSWDPPAELLDGTPVSGSACLRRAERRGERGRARDGDPGVQDTTYVDTGLDNDSEYRYAVRAVRADPRVSAAGPPSDPVTASPADTTPPRPPSNLVVVPSPGALRLAWTASPDDDVALYAVYRATGRRRAHPRGDGPRRHDDLHRPRRARGHRVPLCGHRHRPRAHAERERPLERGHRHRSVSRARGAPRPRVLNSTGAGASIGSLSIGALSIGAFSGEEGWQRRHLPMEDRP